MPELRLAPEAESDLDSIWLYLAQNSGSIEIATRQIDTIWERFWLLAENPYMGRRRDYDLGKDLRSFPAGDHIIIYRVAPEDVVLVLHIIHGRRNFIP